MAIMTRFSKGMQGNIRLDHVKVWPVESEKDKEKWNRFVCRYHYLHDATLCGPQIRYVAECRGKCVALISFSIASWHLGPRDRWIGWDERQRLSRLGFVVQNSRFLIMPDANTPNLASKVLSLCQDRLAHDWMQRHGHPVLLMETFVDRCYPGTSYRADNWIRLGETRGFSRGGPGFYRTNDAPKTLWVKELRPGAAALLSAAQLPPDLALYERRLDGDEKARVFTSRTLESLYDVFRALDDSRRAAGRRHSQAACLTIVACGLLVGCEGLKECADFGRELKQPQLRVIGTHRDVRTGRYVAPCHNTLWRVCSKTDPVEFERLVGEWYNSGVAKPPKAYALDGKTLCGSLDEDGNALHVVSVVSHDRTPFFSRRQRTTKDAKVKRRET
jgi:hypothetical protein